VLEDHAQGEENLCCRSARPGPPVQGFLFIGPEEAVVEFACRRRWRRAWPSLRLLYIGPAARTGFWGGGFIVATGNRPVPLARENSFRASPSRLPLEGKPALQPARGKKRFWNN